MNQYPINGTTSAYRTPSVSTVSSYPPQQFYQPSAIPSTPNGYSRKRRATDQSGVSSAPLNGVSPTEPFHPPTLPSSAQHLPFGQINGFASDFSFTSTPTPTATTNGGPSDKHHHPNANGTHHIPADATGPYDPMLSMPAAPTFDGDPGPPDGGGPSDPSSYHAQRHRSQQSTSDMQQAQQLMTPDDGSVSTDPDKDPFLSLLEQLAENEQSRGGPSELDFFLSQNP
jgi:hypothetical protein